MGFIIFIVIALIFAGFIFINIKIGNLKYRAKQQVLKNTGIFHSGNEETIHMDYRELRVTWISADGTVLYDNDANIGTMDNHMSRPEVKNAFKNGDGSPSICNNGYEYILLCHKIK